MSNWTSAGRRLRITNYALPPMSDYLFVFEASTLPPGQGRTVHLKGRDLAVFNVDGEFYAIDETCSHKGGPLGVGFCQNGQVSCPLHGWIFDVRSGACITRPDRPVRTYPTRVFEGDVQIHVADEETI